MLNRFSLSFRIAIALVVALVVVVALVALARYFIIREKRVAPKQPARSATAPISEEVLRSLTPPDGAKPMEVSQKTLDSLTPPKGEAR